MGSRKDLSEQRAADALAALGNRTRLRVFKLLVRAGREGTNVGTIQRVLGTPATTLAHHLSTLTQAGLVEQERRGREVICTANFKQHFVAPDPKDPDFKKRCGYRCEDDSAKP